MKINIIAHVVMVLFSCGNSIDNVKRFVDYDTISGMMAYDVVIERSDSGILVAKLTAPVMRSVETEDSSFLEFPKGFFATVYEGDTSAYAKIKGNYGMMYNQDELVMARDNVVVENITTKETLETETLFWNQKTKKIYTRNFVKIYSPDKVVYGDSLEADETFSKRVIHGIKATLEIEDPE
ncbi:MAG: LPS export ABC transporter periplasmic protein LptC [Candidatus Limimorpha sp.]